MGGSRHTTWVSVDILTLHLEDATSTVGCVGPNPLPKIVSMSPPSRLHCVTSGDAAVVLQPATAVKIGTAYDRAEGRGADACPDVTVTVRLVPVPAGNRNWMIVASGLTRRGPVTDQEPTVMDSGWYRNCPLTTMNTLPAHGQSLACTAAPEASTPGPAHWAEVRFANLGA